MTKVDKYLNQTQQRKSVNREKHVKEGEISNVKCESNVDEVAANPLDPEAKQTACIDPDTMAKIDSNIKRQSDGFACSKCDYTSTRKNHMREHVEKHIEDLAYPCNFCIKFFRSSNSLRNHKYRYHKRTC